MASYTDYLDFTTGVTLYAEPRPSTNPPAATVAYTENPSVNGEYSATLDDMTDYVVRQQAGGSPASTDTAVAAVTNSITLTSAAVTVTPVQGVVSSPVTATNITVFKGETKTIAIAVTDADGNAVDVSGMTLEVAIEDLSGTDIASVADGSITKVTSTASFNAPSAATSSVGEYVWAMRQTTGDAVLMHGRWTVLNAADVD